LNGKDGGVNGSGTHKRNKKTAKSKSPHAKPAYGAPKFVLGFFVRATRVGLPLGSWGFDHSRVVNPPVSRALKFNFNSSSVREVQDGSEVNVAEEFNVRRAMAEPRDSFVQYGSHDNGPETPYPASLKFDGFSPVVFIGRYQGFGRDDVWSLNLNI
jgi:hypothetical protein